MFFLVGGVHPKTVVLDETRRLCPSCGLAQARLQRIDHYLNLFFIPLLRVKKGEPMVFCQRCGTVSSPDARPGSGTRPKPPDRLRCRNCGALLEPRFNYCPHCGSEV